MDNRITNITLQTLLRSLGDLLMPRVCAVCGRQLLAQERHLCLVCEAGIPFTRFEGLLHNPMADKYNSLVESSRYERAAALFYYAGDYRKITQALKYGRNFSLGRRAARELGTRLAASGLWHGVNIVCPVPLHWTRRWRRGYNQASVIAREVALALRSAASCHSERPFCHSARPFCHSERPFCHSERPFCHSERAQRVEESPPFALFVPTLLRRVRRTGTQTRLAQEARSVNVSGAFCVRERVARRLRKQIGPDLNEILIIDDVCTTGATLASCYAALRGAFGPDVRISAATLAFVE